MKMAKPLLVLPTIAILALELALVGVVLHGPGAANAPSTLEPTVELEVYKNDMLVYRDKHDPLLHNYYKAIYHLFVPNSDEYPVFDTSGSSHTVCTGGTTYGSYPRVILVNENGSFNYDAYHVNGITLKPLNTEIDGGTIKVTATYVNEDSEPVTIYGTALLSNAATGYSSNSNGLSTFRILYALDYFNSPITVGSNQSLTVVYSITVSVGGG